MGKIFGWIFSGTFGKLFGGIMDYRNVKAGIEAGVLKEVILADLETNKLKRDMAIINNGWWVTRWIMPGFAYLMMFHLGAVVIDSVFLFEWNVAALPGPIAVWQGQIILSFFVVRTIENTVGQWLNRGIVSSLVTNAKRVFGRSK